MMMLMPTLIDSFLGSVISAENTSGMTKATITANMSKPELCLASYTLNSWRLYFRPPMKNDRPATRRRLPRTDPVSDASTMPVSPSRNAKIEMISSTAFPNVAFKRPPILGPAIIARLSVALPI